MNQLAQATDQSSWLPTPSNFQEAWQIAETIAGTDMVPKDYKGRPGNVLIALQWGSDLGLPGLQALQNIAVINGRPSIWGDAAKAVVVARPDCQDIKEWLEEANGVTTAYCEVKRKGMSSVVQSFSTVDARNASLIDKQGPWKQYPKRMLQMRARGFALRDAFPDALRGLVLAEEAGDYDMKDMGPAQVSEQQPSSPIEPKGEIVSYDDNQFDTDFPRWEKAIKGKKLTHEDAIARMESRAPLTEKQKQRINNIVIPAAEGAINEAN